MRVEITGRYALFSRPEMRAERFSYEVPTPSAITGILKCIYWKPEMQYHINKIYVLNRPRFSSVTTNSLIRKGSLKPGGKCEYGSHDTTPRPMPVLTDVRYVAPFTLPAPRPATPADAPPPPPPAPSPPVCPRWALCRWARAQALSAPTSPV